MVCAVPFSRFDLFAAVVDKNDVTDQARTIKKKESQGELKIFFCTGLAAQKAHFRQKKGFYRLSETPFFYTSCDQVVIVEVEDSSIVFA